ncbi:MAG: class I tRNA ligase family protein, partial [Gluconacetobacter sp.]
VARMMMMGLHFMKDVPFRTVFIHGLVRDERGQKMSKSKGNGIDPLDMVDQYGADALRFTVCALTGLGRDVKLGQKRIEEYRSFVTKIWNAARFCEMNGVAPVADFRPESVTSPLGRWLLDEAARAVADADAALEAYRFDEYAAVCYRFVWNCFCDWFLEFAKPVFNGADEALAAEIRAVAAHVLGLILRLLQPVMPFVTDELWVQFGFGGRGSLMTAAWPVPERPADAAEAVAELDWVVRFISAIRTVRAEMNVPPSRLAPVLLRDADDRTIARAARWAEAIGRMARVSEVEPLTGEMPRGAAQLVVDEATLVLPLAGIIDLDQERQRLEKERGRLDGEIVKVERKLGNADFVARAKPEVVEENRERLAQFQSERARVEAALGYLA